MSESKQKETPSKDADAAMSCAQCDFVALERVQLQCHRRWHTSSVNSAASFVADTSFFSCPRCPCQVADLQEFKFHLQFHIGEHQFKYYSCVHCRFQSNVEANMDSHYTTVHSFEENDDGDGSYIVKKYKVTHLLNKIQCPGDNSCTETFNEFSQMQLHCEVAHGGAVDFGYLWDFREETDAVNDDDAGVGDADGISDCPASADVTESQVLVVNEPAPANVTASNVTAPVTATAANKPSGLSFLDEMSHRRKNIGKSLNVRKRQGKALESIVNVLNANLPAVAAASTSTPVANGRAPKLDAGNLMTSQRADSRERDPMISRHDNNLTPLNLNSDFQADATSIGAESLDSLNASPSTQLFDSLTSALGLADADEQEQEREETDDHVMSSMPELSAEVDVIGDDRDDTTGVDDATEEAAADVLHCDMCEFCTSTQEAFIEHIKVEHDIEVVSMDTDDSVNTTTDGKSYISGSSGGGKTKMACTVCPYVTDHRRNYNKHMEVHKKVDALSGPAYKCGYCPYIAMSKGPGCNHVRNLHADQPFKLFYVEKIGKKIIKQEEVPMNKSIVALEKQHNKSTSSSLAADSSSVMLSTPSKSQSSSFSSSITVTPTSNVSFTPSLGAKLQGTPSDWFAELTKEEAAFCEKVSGLMKYQCKLCSFMDESCGKVRVHYVQSHPEQLPLLCGYCRERCDVSTFRSHHEQCHHQHPVKVIRQVLVTHPSTSPLDLRPGETEIEEMIDSSGVNDWTAAMRDLVVMEASGTYRCTICNYKQYGTSALKRHVFPIHFKCYPYECQYCQIGMTQVNQLKNHIEKMHQGQPMRVRKPLPIQPTAEDIERVKLSTEMRPLTDGPRTLVNTQHTAIKSPPSQVSPSSAADTVYTGSRSVATSRSPSSRTIKSPAKYQDENFLDPNSFSQDSSCFNAVLSARPTVVDGVATLSTSSPSASQSTLMSPSGEKSVSRKKAFKCHYCNHVSKWTGRDVQRHILTTHLGLKLFNCVYCDFGCYSRIRLETHCATDHPGKPFKVSNLDKRINSVQVVREEPDGVDVLALFKPSGEPVLQLDSKKKLALRKFTLSGKYQVMTRPQDAINRMATSTDVVLTTNTSTAASTSGNTAGSTSTESTSTASQLHSTSAGDHVTSAVSSATMASEMPLLTVETSTSKSYATLTNKYQYQSLTPEEKGKMMRPLNRDSAKVVYKCKLCDILLNRYDRIKYHIVCHHWGLRPYMCPVCDLYKYQKEPIVAHLATEHPGCREDVVNVCDARLDELNQYIEKIENGPEVIGKPSFSLIKTRVAEQIKQESMPRLSPKSRTGSVNHSPKMEGAGLSRNTDATYCCLEEGCNFSGSYESVQHHVLMHHLRIQIYMCDYCSAMRNKLERMLEHLQFEHTTLPQKYTHAYDKYKAAVDSRMGAVNPPEGDSSETLITQKQLRRNSAASSTDTSNFKTPKNVTKTESKSPKDASPVTSAVASTVTSATTSAVTCTVCDATLKNQADFDWHLADVHPQYVRYQCGHCDHLSEDKATLKEHIIEMHSDKPPEYSTVRHLPAELDPARMVKAETNAVATKDCKMCGFVTQTTALLNDHMETTHLSQVLFQCKLCSGLHKTKDDLFIHYSVLHKNDSLQYKVVPLGAEDDDDDDDDDGDDSGEEMDTEPTESRASEASNELVLTDDDGVEMFECEHCDYCSTNEQDFNNHVTTHQQHQQTTPAQNDAQTIKLENTEPTGNTSPGLQGQFVKQYECKHCPYITRECVSIRRHVMTHINYHPYKCPYCDIASIRSNAIKAHMINIHKKPHGQPLLFKNDVMEAAIQEGFTKVFGDVPKRILKETAGYLPPLSQTLNAHSPFAKGNNKPKHDDAQHATSAAAGTGSTSSSAQSILKPKAETKATSLLQTAIKLPLRMKTQTGQIIVIKPMQSEPEKAAKTTTATTESNDAATVTYVCKICKYVVHGALANMRRHVMIHFQYKKFKCAYCEFATIQSQSVVQHVKTSHPGKQPNVITFSPEDLERKVQESISVRSNSGGVASADVTTTASTTTRTPASPLKSLPVAAAPRPTPAQQAVQQIARKYTSYAPAITIIQRKSQLGVSKKKKYHVDESKIPPGRLLYYKCKICDFTENSSLRKCTNMRRHVMSHLNYKRYKCRYCDFGSTTTCMTKAHTRRRHPGMEQNYIDDKDETMERAMRANIIKVGGKPYTTYTYQDSNVDRQIDLTPTAERPFPRFSKQPKPFLPVDPENADEGNYQCLLCNRRTINGTTMKRHISSHFNYRRYGCPYCELLFTQSTFVLNHVRSKHPNQRLHYVDQKIPEIEDKIRDSWVNIKELEQKERAGAIPVLPPAVDGSKLKALLTQSNTSLASFGVVSSNAKRNTLVNEEPEMDFVDGEVEDNSGMTALYLNGGASLSRDIAGADDGAADDAGFGGEGDVNNVHDVKAETDLDPNAPATPPQARAAGPRVQYKCVRCDYSTQHRTSMSRHLMWKIGYKPFHCAHCGAQEITASGIRKHCSRRHRGESQTPLMCKSAEREYELEKLIQDSTVNPAPQQMAKRQTHNGGDDTSPPASKKIKLEPGSTAAASHTVAASATSASVTSASVATASVAKPLNSTAQKLYSDEPIDEKIIHQSQIKLQCLLCGKKSTSRGYIYNHVLRHGPPRLMCGYCSATMYFPKEAKCHTSAKHPGEPLNIKRLWGNRTWDHKNEGIERVSPGESISSLLSAATSPTSVVLTSSAAASPPTVTAPAASTTSTTISTVSTASTATPAPKQSDAALFMGGEYTQVAVSDNIASADDKDQYGDGDDSGSEQVSAGDDVPARLPKPHNIVINDDDFEEAVIERTPVKIPKRQGDTGFYNCPYCEYRTANPNHIKCHMLVHEPPHWRCDHCHKRFVMLYKLRKHTQLIHRAPLRYSNLITGETCRGKKITYADAIFESPARKQSAPAGNTKSPAAATTATVVTVQQQQQQQTRHSTRYQTRRMTSKTAVSARVKTQPQTINNNLKPADVTGNEDFLSDNEASNLMDDGDLVYDCSECDYQASCGDDLLEHYTTQHAEKFLARDVDDVIMNHGDAAQDSMVKDFLQDSVEGLHDYMNDQELD